jgi:hypothetical protein
MATVIYNSFKKKIMDGSIDLDTDTIKVALVSSSYTPSADNHDFFDDITNEVSNSGTYAAGGATLANKAVTQDNTDDEGVFDADDVAWTSTSITARYAIVYKSTGTASTSPLIAAIDFGSDQTSTSGTFTITWAAEGILNLN